MRLRNATQIAACAAALAATGSAQAAITDLFISEYVEGSSFNKAIEIYNGTGSSVDLGAGGYNLQFYFNGSTSATTTINLTGSVANGSTWVVADDGSDAAILGVTNQQSTSNFFNGDDAIVLRKGGTGGTVIDSIGQIGFDPGSQWGSGDQSTADNTLRRKSTITAGDTNTGDAFDPSIEWDGFAQDTFDGLGSHTVIAPVALPSVLINEVAGSTPGTDFEFIELLNTTGSDIDLTNWQIELWDSDDGAIGGSDGGAPYLLSGTLAAGGKALLANNTAIATFGVTADFALPADAIENSSYTMILRDGGGNIVQSLFATDGGAGDTANDAGSPITADFTVGPDGSFIPGAYFFNGTDYSIYTFSDIATDATPEGGGIIASPPPPGFDGAKLSDGPLAFDFGGFDGSGFAPAPGTGQLDSDVIIVTGLSDGSMAFGDTETSGDFARGTSTGGESAGGVYAFDINGNTALGFQPGGSDLTPGSVYVRLLNDTGATVEDLQLAFDLLALNNEARGNSFELLYAIGSADAPLGSLLFSSVAGTSVVSPEAADNLGWQTLLSFDELVNVSLPDGQAIYLQWLTDDATGGGSRDEFALDNIRISLPAPTVDAPAVPEPMSAGLLSLAGLAMLARRRRGA